MTTETKTNEKTIQLAPGAPESGALHSVRFPGESAEYRAARDELLRAEMDLRDRHHEVTEMRQRLPVGGRVREDYIFEEETSGRGSTPVRISELFEDGKDSLILYSFMYGPAVERPCPSCTSILDGLDGMVRHALQRVNVAAVAKSPIGRIRTFARERGWRNLRLLSSAENTYNADYHAESPDGAQWPALNVFVRRDDGIHHFYGTELLYARSRPGQETRHVDAIWPLWHLFDLTPEGRGTDWEPKLSYG